MWLWLGVIVFGGVWFTLNREMGGRGGKGGRGKGGGGEGAKGKILRWVNFALFVLAALSLWLAPMGSWGNIAAIIARAFRAVLGWVGTHWMGGLAASNLAFALSIPLIVAIGLDLWGRKPDKIARFGLLVLVPMCLVAGGALGGLVIGLTTSLTGTGADVLQQLASS